MSNHKSYNMINIVRFQEVITIHMYIFYKMSSLKNVEKSQLSYIITLTHTCKIYSVINGTIHNEPQPTTFVCVPKMTHRSYFRNEVGNCFQHKPRPKYELCENCLCIQSYVFSFPHSLLPNHHSISQASKHLLTYLCIVCILNPTVPRAWVAAMSGIELGI